MIKIYGIGRFCNDPELRNTTAGKSVTNFRLAFRTSVKDNEGHNISDFYNCSAWGGLADNIAKYCHKGDLVAVEGDIRQREYTNKDGINVRTTEITVANLEFAGGPNRNGANQNAPTQNAPTQNAAQKPVPGAAEAGYSDDLPF